MGLKIPTSLPLPSAAATGIAVNVAAETLCACSKHGVRLLNAPRSLLHEIADGRLKMQTSAQRAEDLPPTAVASQREGGKRRAAFVSCQLSFFVRKRLAADAWQLAPVFFGRMNSAGRKNLHCDDDRRDQKNDGDANPHQRRGALLVFERRNIERARRRKIGRIDDSIAEGQECGKHIARQRRGKKIQGN
jgi:hypothetical protein